MVMPTVGYQTLYGTTEAQRPELAGVVLEDKLRDFTFTDYHGYQIASGTVQDRVVRNNDTGTLEFDLRFTALTAMGVDPAGDGHTVYLVNVVRWHFLDDGEDVDFRIDSLGTANPDAVQYNPPGVAFVFGYQANAPSGLPILDLQTGQPGPFTDGTRFFFIKTGATDYAETGGIAIGVHDYYRQHDVSNDYVFTVLPGFEPR